MRGILAPTVAGVQFKFSIERINEVLGHKANWAVAVS